MPALPGIRSRPGWRPGGCAQQMHNGWPTGGIRARSRLRRGVRGRQRPIRVLGVRPERRKMARKGPYGGRNRVVGGATPSLPRPSMTSPFSASSPDRSTPRSSEILRRWRTSGRSSSFAPANGVPAASARTCRTRAPTRTSTSRSSRRRTTSCKSTGPPSSTPGQETGTSADGSPWQYTVVVLGLPR